MLSSVGFATRPEEQPAYSPAVLKSKNVSFDPRTGRLGGLASTADPAIFATMLERFGGAAEALVARAAPAYAGRLIRGRASFRPAEIAGRPSSWRQDDSRLHVDAFPATPSGGLRILRVFTNVNPIGVPRVWRIGEPFERVVQRFAAALRLPWPGAAALLRLARVTKARRTPYDALMLQLHDAMKRDTNYQREAAQESVDFPAGSTWIAFTDAVSHAAMAGQYQFEQTFLLPVDAMRAPDRSPLRILERAFGRTLA